MSILSGLRKPNSRKKGMKILIYGESGSGKTVFALSFPKSIVVDSEDGYSWYEGTERTRNVVGILDSQSYDDLENLMDELDDANDEEFSSLVIDSETKVYENIKEALQNVEETRAARKGRDVLDANLSMRSYGKIGQLSGRLQNAKLRLASQGINIISVAQAADEMEDAGNGQRVKVGEKPNMDKRARFDYDVVIRLFTKDNKYYGEIEKDRLEVFERGDIVENPSYQNWAHRLESKDNQGETVAKDFSKDAEKSQKAYYEEVKGEMSFADRVKEYFATIDADTKKKFVEDMVAATGTKKIKEMNKEQQDKVLALMSK
ncbi:AAA family ATPase [Limosilactobacillus reuteri]|uniref:AAA family ATPase n=1 Tax=Limosilactobacillus reuteri TaxID=1598 RepID=UPI002349D55D|nr:AAA family ATPase [Limosilactobacillus reuteri]MDC6077540.1 AAA family ATPase [Limosilactobacillus reuteri]